MKPGAPSALSRTAALVALAAAILHQLRYLIAFGGGAGAQLERHGHGYLEQALPMLVGVCAALLAGRLLIAAMFGPGARARPLVPAAMRYGLAVLVVYTMQETAEGVLFPAHPDGLLAAWSSSGWIALPLALLTGPLCALAERALSEAERAVAGIAERRGAPRPLLARPQPIGHSDRRRRLLPLAFGLARRPPPELAC